MFNHEVESGDRLYLSLLKEDEDTIIFQGEVDRVTEAAILIDEENWIPLSRIYIKESIVSTVDGYRDIYATVPRWFAEKLELI